MIQKNRMIFIPSLSDEDYDNSKELYKTFAEVSIDLDGDVVDHESFIKNREANRFTSDGNSNIWRKE